LQWEGWSLTAAVWLEEFDDENSGLEPASPYSEAVVKSRKNIMNLINTIRSQLKTLNTNDGSTEISRNNIDHLRAFEILALHIVILSYTEPEETAPTMEEIQTCYENFFSNIKSEVLSKNQKKSSDPYFILIISIVMTLMVFFAIDLQS